MPSLRLFVALTAALALFLPAVAEGRARFHGPLAHIAAGYVPNDPGRGVVAGGWQSVQWNFAGPFGVNAPTAWQNLIAAGAPGGKGVIVAVVDTGVAYSNRGSFQRSPDLKPTSFVRGYDFIDDDPYADDSEGHGTHVASTIVEATNNASGLTGLAYGVRVMPIRVLDKHGEGDSTTIARGVRFAVDHGAKIINLSLEFSTDVVAADIPALTRAISYARKRGALIIGATGNEAAASVAYPARLPDVIAVGATTEHGCLSEFSNRGSGIDLVAPGGGADAELGDPGCNAAGEPGHDIFQVTFTRFGSTRFGMPSGYDGTSMAAPHVSATAALLLASGILGPNPSPAQLRDRIEATARDIGPPGYDRRYGWGLIDAGRATTPGGPLVPARGGAIGPASKAKTKPASR